MEDQSETKEPLIQGKNVSFYPEEEELPEPFLPNEEITNEFIGEEGVDEDFIIDLVNDDDEKHELKNEKFIFQGSFREDDILILIFEEDEQFFDKLVTIEEVKEETILIKDEEENSLILQLDEENNIITQSEDYKIIDIEKVQEFNLNELNQESFEIQDYPEIEIEVTEKKEKHYTFQERKEDFITEMIHVFQAYDNKFIKNQLSDVAEEYVQMIQESDGREKQSYFPFVNDMIERDVYQFPPWIIPIVNNQKKLYREEGENMEDTDDIANSIFLTELDEKIDLNENDSHNYRNYMKSLNKFKPYNQQQSLNIHYDGLYFRNCSNESPCSSLLLNPYEIDLIHTRKSLIIPNTIDSVTEFETVVPKEQVSIIGFHTIPYSLYNQTLRLDGNLDLKELCEPPLNEYTSISDHKYSPSPFTKQFQNYPQKYSHVIGEETEKDDTWFNGIHTYHFNSSIDNKDKIGEVLSKCLPSTFDILHTYPEEVQKKIFNHNDISKLLSPYGINYHSMNVEERAKINKTIQQNIKNYQDNYPKPTVHTKQKSTPKLLSLNEKIQLSRDYIASLIIDKKRNEYYQRFIQLFSRKAVSSLGEDERFLYVKDSDERLLCTHYLYSTKSHNNPELFQTMKSKYGCPEKDGIIYCKVCGEYLCHGDFSILEGFGGEGRSQIQNSREVLEEDDPNIELLNDKEDSIKKIIFKLSNALGIQLTNFDHKKMIDYILSVENDHITDTRYGKENAIKHHPLYIKIKNKYKTYKGTKKQQKKEFTSELKPLKEYVTNCNEMLMVTFLLLFYLQTSIPPYQVKSREYLYLWESFNNEDGTWDQVKNTIHDLISMNTIDKVIVILKTISHKNQRNPFWKNINSFLTESEQSKEMNTLADQFIFTSAYILRDSNIRNQLKNYFHFKNEADSIYLNEYWSSFKPSPNNTLVMSINQKIQEQLKTDLPKNLLKNGSTTLYENISTIQSIDRAQDTPFYQTFNIPYSEILKNESYKRLYDYSVHLHGTSPSIPLLNLLINRFIHTIDDKQKIQALFTSIGWDPNKKQLQKVNYRDLRHIVIKDITDHYKNKNKEDEPTILKYIHINFHNWNGMLLNGTPKRTYGYTPLNAFPNESFQELLEREKERKNDDEIKNISIVSDLFKKYGIDKHDEIVQKYISDNFIDFLLPDPNEYNIQRRSSIRDIEMNEENFHKIINHIIRRNTLKLIPTRKIKRSIFQTKVKHFIKQNNLLNINADEAYPILEGFSKIHKLKGEESEEEYRKIMNRILDYNKEKINKMKEFFVLSHESGRIDENQVKRYQKIFGPLEKKLFEAIPLIYEKYLESSPTIPNDIREIKYILGRLSIPKTNDLVGTVLHDNIPKQWKISDTSKEHIQKFLNYNEFLLHNEVFMHQKDQRKIEIEISKNVQGVYRGFNKYKDVDVNGIDKYSAYFSSLLLYFKRYYHSGINELNGDDKSPYTENYSKIMKQFLFVFLMNKLVEYVEELYDEQSEVSQIANELYTALQEKDKINLNDSIQVCSQLIFDLLNHFIEAYYDPSWIYQTKDISNKLSKQKEKEKQNLINTLESKDSDSRLATMDMQKFKITNWWQNFGDQHLKNQETSAYQEQMTDERIDHVKQLFYENEGQLEALEALGFDPNVPLSEKNIREGYSQKDEDREDEGGDDADDNGNYREN